MNLFLVEIYKAILSRNSLFDLNKIDLRGLRQVLDLGLGPWLQFLISRQDQQVKYSHLDYIHAADLSARVLTGNQVDAANTIFNACKDFAGKIVVLKGLASAYQFYPQPYMRLMGDIDLLVPESLQNKLETICFDLGYVQKSNLPASFYEGFHHSMPLYNAEKNVWIEIHTALIAPQLPGSEELVFSSAVFSNEVVKLERCEYSVWRLSSELELVYLAAHLLEELRWTKIGVRILDILFIFNGRQLDWSKILSWLEKSPVAATYLSVVVNLVKAQNLADISDAHVEKINKCAKNMDSLIRCILVFFVKKYVFSGKAFGRILTQNNVNIICKTLLDVNKNPFIKLFIYVPKNLIFPPRSHDRFNPKFQIKRIRTMLTGKNGE